jgi:hypothetical protein
VPARRSAPGAERQRSRGGGDRGCNDKKTPAAMEVSCSRGPRRGRGLASPGGVDDFEDEGRGEHAAVANIHGELRREKRCGGGADEPEREREIRMAWRAEWLGVVAMAE